MAFMLELVPEPVWNTSTGKCAMQSPSSSCWQAPAMASPMAASSCSRSTLARAAAALARIRVRTKASGMRSPETGKLFTARWVWAP
ncbi:hypothetical protein D3C77_738640 [compost metagenome]